MKVVDINGNTLNRDTLDLTKGYLVKGKIPKSDAIPIDNVVKFAWEDSDFEEVEIYKLFKPKDESAISPDEDRDAMLVDLEYRLTLIELGV